MLALALCPALAACGGGDGRERGDNGADIADAAHRAQESIDDYAARRARPVAPAAMPSVAAPAPHAEAAPVPEDAGNVIADVPPEVVAHYTCDNGPATIVRFDNRAATARLEPADAAPVVLAQQRAASGIWYVGEGWELRGKGRDATIRAPDGMTLTCVAGE